MTRDEIIYELIAIFSPFINFFLLKVLNLRAERVVCEFYSALKEKNPRSYLTQNKLIKTIRKFSGMNTKWKIHWVHCIGNYLQLIAVITPLILLILHLVYCINGIVYIMFDFCGLVIVLWGVFIGIFTLCLCFRCKKIKKNNPKYSHCELREWGGM